MQTSEYWGVPLTYELLPDGSITQRRPLPTGAELLYHAAKIRDERTGIHARLGVALGGVYLAWHTFNVDRDDERVRLCNSTHGQMPQPHADACPKSLLKKDLDDFCRGLWAAYLEVEAAEIIPLHEREEPGEVGHVLDLLLPIGQPTVIYGERGAGKSYLGAKIAHCVATGTSLLGKLIVPQSAPIYYLDWETDWATHRRRLGWLSRGDGAPIRDIHYRQMRRPLEDEADRVQSQIRRLGAQLLIIDSLAPAAARELLGPEGALGLHSAIRTIDITTLILAQQPRGSTKATAHLFGSVLFEYLARCIWRLVSEPVEDGLHCALFHEKPFEGRLQPPLGFRIDFDDEARAARFASDTVGTLGISEGTLMGQDAVWAALDQPMTPKQIADEIDMKAVTVRSILSRGKGRRFVKSGETWTRLETRWE